MGKIREDGAIARGNQLGRYGGGMHGGHVGAMNACDQYSGVVNARISPSRMLGRFVLLALAATLALLAVTPMPASLKILAGTWTLCLALHAWSRLAQARRIAVSLSGTIIVETRAGTMEGMLCERCFVAPFLTVVHWRPAGKRFSRALAIAPDMMAEREFRALRVLLRWR